MRFGPSPGPGPRPGPTSWGRARARALPNAGGNFFKKHVFENRTCPISSNERFYASRYFFQMLALQLK